MSTTTGVTVHGYSDDLVEVDGAISEEFSASVFDTCYEGNLLAFSDGTVLRITYGDGWRIVPVHKGSSNLTIAQHTEHDDSYTDAATLDGPITWVVFGERVASAVAEVANEAVASTATKADTGRS